MASRYFPSSSAAQQWGRSSGATGSVTAVGGGVGKGGIQYRFDYTMPQRQGGGPSYGQTTASIQQADVEAKAANLARYKEAKGKYEQIETMFSPGGDFGKGYSAYLAQAKSEDVARGTQSLVSSGLYGTTQAAGLGTQWEKQVGAPARLKLEDVRTEKYGEALRGTAGLIERREDVGPNYALIAQLIQGKYA